jgi:hypothetical protein
MSGAQGRRRIARSRGQRGIVAAACNPGNKHYRLSCRRAGSSPPSDPRDIVDLD